MRLDVNNLNLFGIDLNQLGRWWWRGLGTGRASEWLGYFLHPSPRVQVRVTDEWLSFFRPGPGEAGEIARVSRNDHGSADAELLAALSSAAQSNELLQLDLVLPAGSVLRKRLSLPVEASGNLREAIGYQLGRLTPFPADKLYYDARIDESASSSGQIDVDLLAAARTHVDPLIAQVERLAGLQVSSLRVQGEEGVNLFGASRVPGRWWRRLNINSYLLLALLLSVLMAAIAPVLKERHLMLERKALIVELNTQASGLAERKANLEKSLDGLSYIVVKRAGQPLPSEVLAEMTRRVPDNAFITSFQMKGNILTLSGFGREVIDLIRLINESDRFTDARFTAPVSRNARTGFDQFSISVQLTEQAQGETQ